MSETGDSSGVRTVPAQRALLRLRQEPRGPVRFVSSLFVRYRPRRGLPESKALVPYRTPQGKPAAASLFGAFSLPRVIEQAEALGFRYLSHTSADLLGYIPRDAWLSTDGHVRGDGAGTRPPSKRRCLPTS